MVIPVMRRHFLGVATTALAAAAAGSLAWPGRALADTAPLTPRRVFSRDPDRTAPRLSPDGRSLAWLEPHDGVLNLVMSSVEDPSHPRRLTFVTGRSIFNYFAWAFTNKHIVFFRDDAGDENYRPFSVAIETREVLPLLPPGRSSLQRRARRTPNEMLFGHNGRDPALADLIRVDITTGEARPLFQNPGFAWMHTTGDFAVRFGTRFRPDGSAEVMLWEPDGRWSRFLDIPAEDALTTELEAISDDGRSAFVIDLRGRETAALIEIDIATRETRVLAEDPEADIAAGVYDPGSGRPFAAYAVAERQRWHPIEPAWAFDLDHIRAAQGDGDVGINNLSSERGKVVLSYFRSDASTEFRIYDPHKQAITPLFKARSDLDGLALRPMRPVTIPASDGVKLPGYLTLPDDEFRNGPVVLFIHGGPYARDEWGYSGTHQWLASRGYAVLSVNYRGSTGYGKRFVALADQEWGGRMQDDLTDAAGWLVAQGIADPKRLGFFGGSYGGYAALMAATKTPDTFACIVDLFGIANLVTFTRAIPPYWRPWFPMWTRRLADPETEAGRQWLRERSPLSHFDRITCPLLIGQGLRDVRVTAQESEQIVQAMRQRGLPVTYVTFADEGHGFVRQENRLAFSAVAEMFLAQHLGGRAEPLGDAFDGSTIEFQTGKELVHGVS